MVVSGLGQDKATTNSLVQYSGVGIDLGERSPGAEKIAEAAGKVLADDSYKARGKVLSKEYVKYDVGRVFDQTIQEVVRKWKAKQTTREEL
jgi:UDP:flavonoid glycosyltransferase YjiC (YdhE family)